MVSKTHFLFAPRWCRPSSRRSPQRRTRATSTRSSRRRPSPSLRRRSVSTAMPASVCFIRLLVSVNDLFVRLFVSRGCRRRGWDGRGGQRAAASFPAVLLLSQRAGVSERASAAPARPGSAQLNPARLASVAPSPIRGHSEENT